MITAARSLLLSALFLPAAALVGCHSAPPACAPTASSAPAPAPKASELSGTTPPPAGDAVVIAPDLRAICGIGDLERAPKFALDSAALESEGRQSLDALATCLHTGPLKGRAVSLVGRADPRGPEGYNEALGLRRADSVSAYLESLGVPPNSLRTTSRGELDATGHDETTWALDRRVDVSAAL